MPQGAATLRAQGLRITVEESPTRVVPIEAYRDAGCEIVPRGAWHTAPVAAVILGIKELPDGDTPLGHCHVMFGHAFKGQAEGRKLLARLRAGGGELLDLEYLKDDRGRRLAAFGHWAGFTGAAATLIAWSHQRADTPMPPLKGWSDRSALLSDVRDALNQVQAPPPQVLIIGAAGRVGGGAAALCAAVGVPVVAWDKDETAGGPPFPAVLEVPVMLNCIVAGPETPMLVAPDAVHAARTLTIIGDLACDPTHDFNPIRVYDRLTSWEAPIIRVHDTPPLDVLSIDNLPSLLPLESSDDFAEQLLPLLQALPDPVAPVWQAVRTLFREHAGIG